MDNPYFQITFEASPKDKHIYRIKLSTQHNKKMDMGDWVFPSSQEEIYQESNVLRENDYEHEERIYSVIEFGKQLFTSLPEKLQDILWQYRNGGFGLQIHFTDNRWIPWEWCYLINDGSEAGFLCRLYALAQWPLKSERAAAAFPFHLAHRVSYNWNHEKDQTQFRFQDESQPPLSNQIQRKYKELPANHFKYDGFFNSNADAWLLLVEAFHEPKQHTYGFLYGDGHRFLIQDLDGQRLDRRGTKPLVIFACCTSGQVQANLFGIKGWPKSFIQAGAGACICLYFEKTLKTMASFMEDFDANFYEKGMTLGEAVQKARIEDEGALDVPKVVLYGNTLATYDPQLAPDRKQTSDNTLPLLDRLAYYMTPRHIAYGLLGCLTLLAIFWGLGTSAHYYRIELLSIPNLHLTYPHHELISTGFLLVSKIPSSLLAAFFYGHFYLKCITFGSLLWLITLIRWPRAVQLIWPNLIYLLFAIWTSMILLTGLEMENPQTLSSTTAEYTYQNPMDHWVDEVRFWLVSEGLGFERQRQAFFGATVWYVMGLIVAFYQGRGIKEKYPKWLFLVFISILLIGMATRLPQAFAYGYWGAKYPRISLPEELPDDFPIPQANRACCIYNISEGSHPFALISICDNHKSHWTLDSDLLRGFQIESEGPIAIYALYCH